MRFLFVPRSVASIEATVLTFATLDPSEALRSPAAATAPADCVPPSVRRPGARSQITLHRSSAPDDAADTGQSLPLWVELHREPTADAPWVIVVPGHQLRAEEMIAEPPSWLRRRR